MEPFLEAFGGLTLGTIAVLIAAIIFMWKIYKKGGRVFRQEI